MTSTKREREQFEDLPILRELRDLLEVEFATARAARRHAVRRRRWFRGRSRLAVVLALVLVGGGTAIAAGVFSGERSAALSGRFSRAEASGPLAGASYAIGLYPNLTAGTVGWCTGVGYSYRAGDGARIVGSWSCASATAAVGSPIFAACGCGGTGPWFVLTAPQVAAVRIAGGPTVLTRTDPRLPFGWRAAVVASGRRAPIYELTALDATGRSIAGTEAVTPVQATRSWRAPHAAVAGVCTVVAARQLGLRATSGTVVSRIVPDPGILGGAFLPCVNVEYSLGPDSPLNRLSGRPTTLLVAVLLDARQPGTAPAALPGGQRVPRTPGYIDDPNAPSVVNQGLTGFTAKRVGDAWLIVAGGAGTAQRVAALRQMTIGPIDLRSAAPPAQAPADALCWIGSLPTPGLREISQTANSITPPAYAVTQPILSECARAYFDDGPWPIAVNALLRYGPAGIPGEVRSLAPIAGHPGYFEGPQDQPGGAATWRHLGVNWLQAQGGSSKQQRQTILSDLTLQTHRR